MLRKKPGQRWWKPKGAVPTRCALQEVSELSPAGLLNRTRVALMYMCLPSMAREAAEHNVTSRNARATAIVVAAGDCGHAQVEERGVVIASVTRKTILFGHALPGENPESLFK